MQKPFWPAANEPNIAASLLHLGLITVGEESRQMASGETARNLPKKAHKSKQIKIRITTGYHAIPQSNPGGLQLHSEQTRNAARKVQVGW